MRTTTTLRQSALRRRKPLRARRANRRSERERDTGYMAAVRKLPCIVRELAPSATNKPTTCCGEVQADHAGMRPFGRKADDSTCIPLCRKHHTERTDHHGMFFALTRDELRTWRVEAIAWTQRQVQTLRAGWAA